MNCSTCYSYYPDVGVKVGMCWKHNIDVLEDNCCPDWDGRKLHANSTPNTR